MNKNEHKIREKYEKEGWRILHKGAPDFLMLKIKGEEIVDVMFVEVKTDGDETTYEQDIWRKALKFLRVKYKLEHIHTNNKLNPVHTNS